MTLTARQQAYLDEIRREGDTVVKSYHPAIVRRTIAALLNKGLVRVSETHIGWFVVVPVKEAAVLADQGVNQHGDRTLSNNVQTNILTT